MDLENIALEKKPTVKVQVPDMAFTRVLSRSLTAISRSQRIPLRERVRHFTFAWYTLTMSTGGIALLLALTPHRFTGLDTIGLVVFIFDLFCFLLITAALLMRFLLYPIAFSKALTHPNESLFISTFFLSLAAMLCNIQEYGSTFLPSGASTGWLATVLRVSFWLYLSLTFVVSVGQYHLLFTAKETRRLTPEAMTPAWILPVFPIMLAGTLAAFFSPYQTNAGDSLAILAAGLAAQGLGFLVSVCMYSTYLSRLMAYGLPSQRPGMFIAVGPPSFTAAALVGMASDVPRVLASLAASSSSVTTSSSTSSGEEASFLLAISLLSTSSATAVADTVQLAALASSVFLWGLAFWFFAMALVATLAGMPDARFHLSWWSFVFPNVGFTVASIRLGHVLGSEGVLWFASAMTLVLVGVWAFVAARCVVAVVRKEIVWPGRDEDSD